METMGVFFFYLKKGMATSTCHGVVFKLLVQLLNAAWGRLVCVRGGGGGGGGGRRYRGQETLRFEASMAA